MKWTKLGQVFKVNNSNPYLLSHASNPLAIHLEDNIYRVYYSGRNIENKSSVGYVDIDLLKLKVVNYPKEPVVVFGSENSFYSHGISIGNHYLKDDKYYILFMGWQIRGENHWRGDIGQLELHKNYSLEVTSEKPFMGISQEDMISLSYPYVIFHEGIYKMWYGSTIDWTSENSEMIHVIKYAESKDGENWDKKGIAIPYQLGVAQAFSRPSVIIDKDGYHMWYSYRSGTGEKYRIGYSHSLDGIHWVNKLNQSGITVEEENSWDSEMVCYPFVFDHNGDRYMFYNGNSFGKEGFGLAKLEKDE